MRSLGLQEISQIEQVNMRRAVANWVVVFSIAVVYWICWQTVRDKILVFWAFVKTSRKFIVTGDYQTSYQCEASERCLHKKWINFAMLKLMGAKRKERDKVRKAIEPDKKWWKFLRKTKVKPVRHLDIQHNVNLTRGYDGESECYEMGKYMDRDNNHYRWVGALITFWCEAWNVTPCVDVWVIVSVVCSGKPKIALDVTSSRIGRKI